MVTYALTGGQTGQSGYLPLQGAIAFGGGALLGAGSTYLSRVPVLNTPLAFQNPIVLAKGGVLSSNGAGVIKGIRSPTDWAQGVANRQVFPSGGDRLFDSLGPARLNHAEEFADSIARIESAGGTVEWRAGQYGFSPAREAPGKIILDPSSSISAVRHEVGHFFDDIGRGSPGMGFYLMNPEVRWGSEFSSYLGEIKTARQIGDRNAARALLNDAREERMTLLGY